MEYIQGDDLKHHLDRGVRYSLEQSLKIDPRPAQRLDYAHKQGIVHRDIKPANLLIEPGGRVKLTDFGVARIQDSGEATRTQGSMVGTLKYMAPEQVQGQKIDSRADLFSVGVVLYQLLTDKRPSTATTTSRSSTRSSATTRLRPAASTAGCRRRWTRWWPAHSPRSASSASPPRATFAVALQAAIRRAEDQTVVPPVNPNKGRAERLASADVARHVPGTRPRFRRHVSPVTQETGAGVLEGRQGRQRPEELQGFLEKIPAGIYAGPGAPPAAQAGGGEQTVDRRQPAGTGPSSLHFAATQFPAHDRTAGPGSGRAAHRPRGPWGGDASDLRPATSGWTRNTRGTLVQTAGTAGHRNGDRADAAMAAAPAPAPVAPLRQWPGCGRAGGGRPVAPEAPSPLRSVACAWSSTTTMTACRRPREKKAGACGRIGALAVAGALRWDGRSSTPPARDGTAPPSPPAAAASRKRAWRPGRRAAAVRRPCRRLRFPRPLRCRRAAAETQKSASRRNRPARVRARPGTQTAA
jgi:serine/threonine-protein kinase